MRNAPDHSRGHNPLDSYAEKLFNQHPPRSEWGITIRRGDARLRLQEILAVESAIQQQEILNAEIESEIERQQAEHELNMQYLMQYGVRADERRAFQQLLEQASEHGGLSLREAADLAHTMIQQNGVQENGSLSVVDSMSVESESDSAGAM